MKEKLTAIYYPDCYPANRSLFAGMCLYFDEVHFVSPSDDASSKERYTAYLAGLDPKGLTISVIGDMASLEEQRDIQRAAAFFQFVLDARPLIGSVVHFHPNLQTTEIKRVSQMLLKGGIPADDWSRFLQRQTREADILGAFAREHPELNDAVLRRLLPTARDLSARFGYVPVSDHPSLRVPIVSTGSQLADTLASAAGLAILKIAMPCPLWTEPDDLLELRLTLSEEIEAYRLLTLKLAGRLRALLNANAELLAVQQEAEFLAKTEVLPHVADIRRRIEAESGKLWRRVFGTTLKWMSIGVSSYVDPSGAMVLKAIKEAGSDLTHLTESAQGISLAGDPGISFLFELEKHLRD